MSTPLLRTKLYIPSPRPELVPRPRLIERLNAGIHRKLTLISAPAGFGKTTLLSEWIHSRVRSREYGVRDREYQVGSVCKTLPTPYSILPTPRFVWLSLDKEDDDPVRFWSYLIAALQTIDASLGQSALQTLQSPQPPSIQLILTTLLNQIAALSGRITLVLDDYHVISIQAIHDGVAFLLNHQPRQLHLVISTRADPPLATFRLRARNQLTELRSDDLRFTADEAAAFLNGMMGLGLTPEDVAALESRTEGWIVGLQLAALSMQGCADTREFIKAFTGSHHYILEYLTEEVVRRQPEPVQRFLKETSILDRLSGPLCDAVRQTDTSPGEGDGEAMLARLLRRNLFIVPLDDERRWYRYHHLFADLLGNLLRKQAPPERISKLHRRASQWYEQYGLLEKAITHALQAQDFERAAGLIEQAAGTTLSRGSVATLLRWVETLPEELVLDRPRIRMYQGWATFLNGQTSLAGRILQDAKTTLQALPASPDSEMLHGRLTALLATIATLHLDMPRAIQEAQEALAHLPEDDLVWRARATRALAAAYGLSGDTNKLVQACHEARDLALAAGNLFLAADIISQLASAQFHQGRLRQAIRTYREIINLVEHPSRFPPAGLGYIGLAGVSLEWNDLDVAEDHVNKGIELCRQGGIGHNLIPAYCTQAIIRQALGDTEGALEAIRKTEQIHGVTRSPFMAVRLAWYQVRLRLSLGDVEVAARWAKGDTLASKDSFENLPTVLRETQQVALARVYLAQGEPEKVLAIYDQLCAPARSAGRMARVIEISLLKALALQAQGESAAALAPLEQCLSLAEPGGYVRLFLEAGAPMAALLRQAASRGIAAEYVSQLLAAFAVSKYGDVGEAHPYAHTPTLPHFHTPPLVEPLTRRELEVLQLICEGYSNQQIAEALMVTLNTVKKHTSNIYGKLDVTSRTQAIAWARELGLF